MTQEKKPEQKKETDWSSIALHYRAGKRSLEDIGKEFGVTKGRISQVAKRDEWERQAKAPIDRPMERAVSLDESRAGFIYVLMVEADGQRYFKIGMSTNFGERLATHQCGCPLEIKVVCCYFVGDMRAEERELHAGFADKRVRGEWFLLDQADLELIAGRGLLV